MQRLLLLSLVVLVCVMSVVAQDPQFYSKTDADGGKPGGKGEVMVSSEQTRTYASAQRTSPFPTPTPTDTRFVQDEGPGLDTGCQYRAAGSLKFNITVTRAVGPTNGDGSLQNPQALVNNGVVSRYATLTMPAYDVDFNATPPAPYHPERDRIFLNGQPLGELGPGAFLTGEDNKWRMNEILVPIEYVRFARMGQRGSGQEPTASVNEIEILIDQANLETNTIVWCTKLDWGALSFKALAPVVMVHGNGESGAFWDRLNFTRPFQQQGIPYDNSINLPTTLINNNAGRLASEIPRIAREFGAKHVHLVTHSKGGLDSRAFLKSLPSEGQLAVLSMTTLSTPHHGSVLADYVRDAQNANAWHSDDYWRTVFFDRQDFDEGRQNLTTEYVKTVFNPSNLPLPGSFTVDGEQTAVKYFSFGADANVNQSFNGGEPTIQTNEMAGTGYDQYSVISSGGGTMVYRTLYRLSETVAEPDGHGHLVVRERRSATINPNDLLVTIQSSRLPAFMAQPDQPRNHANIANEGIGVLVLNLVRSAQPVQ